MSVDTRFEAAAWPLIVVAGPTCSGKSAAGLRLAEGVGGEIVNCDSVQVYRGMDVGTAKTPAGERRGVPHHLIDVAAPDQELTAGAYARLARRALGEIRGRGRVPVVVGGSGFYLRALLEGLSPAPQRNEELRARLNAVAKRRPGALHRYLRRYDRAAAERIHANDAQKLVRAIEMTRLAGRPASATQALARDRLRGYRVMKLGLLPPRAALYRAIDERTLRMFDSPGILEETKALLDAGVAPNAKALQSVGYKQAVQALAGEATVEQARLACQTRTRQYAKRQLTWFRADGEIRWLHGFGTDPSVQEEILAIARSGLT